MRLQPNDAFWLARLPNTVGGVHLELFDSAEALRLNLEGDEIAQHYSVLAGAAWALFGQSRACLPSTGPAWPAEACFRRAEALLRPTPGCAGGGISHCCVRGGNWRWPRAAPTTAWTYAHAILRAGHPVAFPQAYSAGPITPRRHLPGGVDGLRRQRTRWGWRSASPSRSGRLARSGWGRRHSATS